MKSIQFIILFIIGSVFVMSCDSTNMNSMLFVDEQDEERLDSLLSKAQILYDTGKFDESLKITNQALALNPNNEQIIQLKAFNQVSLAGFGIIDMITKIASSTSSLSGETADLLGSLAEVLEVNASDFSLLADVNDASSISIFEGLPVYHPIDPGEYDDTSAPRNQINTLRYLNEAINTVCPFISEDLRKTDDVIVGSRYTCKPFEGRTEFASQAYFIFFLSHLAETLIFNMILLSNPDDTTSTLNLLEENSTQTGSNIFKRIAALQDSLGSEVTIATLGDVTAATTQVIEDTAKIFNTNAGSLLSELMNNLRKAVGSFAYMAGMPDTITEQLNNALDSIFNAVDSVGGATSELQGQTNALKEQLGGAILTNLNAQVDDLIGQINTLESSGSLTASELAELEVAKANAKEMCSSLDTFVEGSSLSAPSSCDDL